MKKDKRLLDSIGNIPDRFIEEAFFGSIVKTEKRKWITVLAAAACLIGAVAIPAAVLNGKNNVSDNNDNSMVTTAVSETGPDDIYDYYNTSESEKIQIKTVPFMGTGPERPGDYEPDRVYSSVHCFLDEDDDGYASVSFLKDKEFEKRINSDIREVIDNIISSTDTGTNTEETRLPGYIYDIYDDIDEVIDKAKIKHRLSDYYYYDMSNIINGYMSIEIGCREKHTSLHNGVHEEIDSLEHRTVLVYDIIEGKRIEKITDMFYGGEEFALIFPGYLEGIPDDRPVSDELPELFGADYFYIKFIDSQSGEEYYRKFDVNTVDSSICDSMISGRYRDPKDILAAGTYDIYEYKWDEWRNEDVFVQTDSGQFIEPQWTSRFHTQQECAEFNRDIKKAVKAAADHIGVRTDADTSFCVGSHLYLKDIYAVKNSSDNYFRAVYVSKKDFSIITVDDILGDWAPYVYSCCSYYDGENIIEDCDVSEYEYAEISYAAVNGSKENTVQAVLILCDEDDDNKNENTVLAYVAMDCEDADMSYFNVDNEDADISDPDVNIENPADDLPLSNNEFPPREPNTENITGDVLEFEYSRIPAELLWEVTEF